MKLATKLLLVFLTAVFLMIGVSTYLAVLRARERFEQRQHEYVQSLGREWEGDILGAWQGSGDDGLMRAIRELIPSDQQLQVRWVWFDQQVPGSHEPAAPRSNWPGMPQRRVVSVITQDAEGVRHIHSYYPVNIGAPHPGALEFTGSLDPLERQTRDTIVTAAVSLASIGLAGAAIVIVAGIRWVARPLTQLVEKTRRIGEGDFAGPLPVRGNDELSQLAMALNEMCDQLSRQQDRIQAETRGRISALEQLRHADRLKTVGRLAAGIAHEVGTPLSVVSGRAALIAAGSLPSDQVQSSAVTIKSEADRIANIIRQLLDFARRRSPQRSHVKLHDLIADSVALLRPLADKRRVSVQLAASEATAQAWLDYGQMQQVLTNLLVNAIQSMDEGGQARVTLGCASARPPDEPEAAPRRYWTICVQDEGVGIPPEDLALVFEPFFTTKQAGEGTGLGLSIAHGIVQEHGGWIEAASQPGRGSRFTVYVPREENDPCAEPC